MTANTEADFDALFQRGYPSLVRALTAMCGDRELAADCVQEAFCKAYARWRKISRYEQPLAWVRHVAVNQLRDDVRRRERANRHAPKLVGDATMESTEPAEFDLASTLAALPTQQRIAAALYYVEQLSVGEIAEAMGLSSGAIKFHLHAAREQLRGTLAAHDPSRDVG